MKGFYHKAALIVATLAALDLLVGSISGAFSAWPLAQTSQHILADVLVLLIAGASYND